MASAETSESTRDLVSETESNNWEMGVLEHRRQMQQVAQKKTADGFVDTDFLYGVIPSSSEDCPRKVAVEGNECVVVLGGNKLVKLDCFEFAQISPYFRAAFFGNFEEAKKKLLMFGDPEPDGFLSCLGFVRRLLVEDKDVLSKTPFDLDQALEILDVAAYLLIEPVLEVISDIIVQTVTAVNLIAVYHKAENRHPPLAGRLWRMIVREFDKVRLNKTFFELKEEELMKLLDDKYLNICKEKETAMVRSWIEANRWRGKTVADLQNKLTLTQDCIGFYGGGNRLPSTVILASGGWSNVGPTVVVETLDAPSKQWVRSEVKLFDTPRAYHGVVSTGDDMYTLGGFNGAEYYRSTRKFNLKTMEIVEVAPMYDQRCYVACGLLDEDSIVAFGGYDNHDRLRSAEILHIATNQWKRIADLSFKRSDGHCIIHDGKINAIGGFDGVNCHATIETYDPQGDRWIMQQNAMRSRRSGVRAVIVEGTICVCGGFDGSSRLSSCEFVDPREGRWHVLKPMNNPRSNFGIETLNNQVIVAGGYAGVVGTISDVEAFDFRADAWIELPSMSMRRSAVYLSRIDNHDIIEKLVRPVVRPPNPVVTQLF